MNDSKGSLSGADFIGETSCALGEIVGAPGQQLVKTLRLKDQKESRGNIILRAEEVTKGNEKLYLEMQGDNLENISGWFRRFKPMFILSRSMEAGGWQRVYTSDFVYNQRSPSWQPFEIKLQTLCNND